MKKSIIIFVILLVVIGGCLIGYFILSTPKIPPHIPNPDNHSVSSCNVPADCGSFNDCINSKCVQINPPSLP